MAESNAERQQILVILASLGISVSAAALAALGLIALPVGITVAGLGGGAALAAFAKSKRLKQQYVLEDQDASDIKRLLNQLKDDSHVVVAWYTEGEKLKSFIVACKDEERMQEFHKKGWTLTLEEARRIRKQKEVIFTGGPL